MTGQGPGKSPLAFCCSLQKILRSRRLREPTRSRPRMRGRPHSRGCQPRWPAGGKKAKGGKGGKRSKSLEEEETGGAQHVAIGRPGCEHCSDIHLAEPHGQHKQVVLRAAALSVPLKLDADRKRPGPLLQDLAQSALFSRPSGQHADSARVSAQGHAAGSRSALVSTEPSSSPTRAWALADLR